MAQMNVSLPDGLKSWAEARVAEGRYSCTSDYVRDLMRRDQDSEERRRALQAAIDLGRASGSSEQSLADIVAEGRQRRAKAYPAGTERCCSGRSCDYPRSGVAMFG